VEGGGAAVADCPRPETTRRIPAPLTEAVSAPRWVEVLLKADREYGSNHEGSQDYNAGIKEMRSWTFELAANSRAALIYAYWRMQLMEDLGGGGMKNMAQRVDFLREPLGEAPRPPSLTDNELRWLTDSFAKAMTKLRTRFGTMEKTYGEVFRVGRGDLSWPCEGGMAEFLGLTTLRSVQHGPEHRDHTRWAQSGQTSTGIAVLTSPIRSRTYVPLDQSSRPDSPRYCDQAEKAFNPRRMKPTWWTPEELAGHIESRTVIDARR
jgi:acyl-homoserine lactone acylase PvdQ